MTSASCPVLPVWVLFAYLPASLFRHEVNTCRLDTAREWGGGGEEEGRELCRGWGEYILSLCLVAISDNVMRLQFS